MPVDDSDPAILQLKELKNAFRRALFFRELQFDLRFDQSVLSCLGLKELLVEHGEGFDEMLEGQVDIKDVQGFTGPLAIEDGGKILEPFGPVYFLYNV